MGAKIEQDACIDETGDEMSRFAVYGDPYEWILSESSDKCRYCGSGKVMVKDGGLSFMCGDCCEEWEIDDRSQDERGF